MSQPRLTIIPIARHQANAFIEQHHRHHKKVHGLKFAIGVQDETGKMRGVAVVGRPTSRHLDDGLTAEVTRLATDGCENACSALYAAAWRAARAMGYLRMGTYILASEPGTSLRAAGWRELYTTRGGSWDRKSRPRVDKHPLEPKVRWGTGIDPARAGEAA